MPNWKPMVISTMLFPIRPPVLELMEKRRYIMRTVVSSRVIRQLFRKFRPPHS